MAPKGTINLGFVKAIHSGVNPPLNKKMVWYDENEFVHKVWDVVTETWDYFKINPGQLNSKADRNSSNLTEEDILSWREKLELFTKIESLEKFMQLQEFTYDGKIRADKIEALGLTEIILTDEVGISAFVLNQANYEFQKNDIIAVLNSQGTYDLYIYIGYDKSNIANYLATGLSNITISMVQGLQQALDTKLDKGTYTGTAQNLKDDIDSKANSSDVYKKNETYSQTEINGFLSGKQNTIGYTPENVENKSDSYTISSSTTYASTKALVDGLGTKNYIKSNESLSLAQRKDDILYGILDQYTGEEIILSKVTGTPTVDGVIHFQLGSEYFKRVYKEAVNIKWFGVKGDGTDEYALVNSVIQSFKNIEFPDGTYNLNFNTVLFPAGVQLIMKGGKIINADLIGNETLISCYKDYEAFIVSFHRDGYNSTFKTSSQIYFYKTAEIAKTKTHWAGKQIKTGGFWYENDGGGGDYICYPETYLKNENSYFMSYWVYTNIAGGAGLYTKFNNIWAKYTGRKTELDLAFFGVKYDAKYLNPSDDKYYSDAGFTTLATDNYEQVRGAIGQLRFWSEQSLPRVLSLSKVLVINKTLILRHGAHSFMLKGSGYADQNIITSNVTLDALVENYYDDATPNILTGTTYVFQDLSFRGYGRISNGLVVKNGYETDALIRLEFQDFTNAGLVFYGTSSTFKLETVSCFRNKYGVLLTSTHPYRLTDNTINLEGLISLYKISGDDNTDALVAIDATSDGASINIQSIKSERNNNATVLIKKSSENQAISIKNAFTNGYGDFLKIENYVGNLPTIEMEGIFQNDSDFNNWDINDLKNSKQIRFAKNPNGAFPHIIYTNAGAYEKGFLLYENGDLTAFAKTASPSFTGTPTAPTAIAGTNTTQIATTAFVQNAMTSGTYTPTLTNTTNISSSILNAAYYTKIGNIVTVTIAGQITLTTTATATLLTFTLPISGAIPINGVGQGNVTSGGDGINAFGVINTISTTQGEFMIGAPVGTGSGVFSITFTYSL